MLWLSFYYDGKQVKKNDRGVARAIDFQCTRMPALSLGCRGTIAFGGVGRLFAAMYLVTVFHALFGDMAHALHILAWQISAYARMHTHTHTRATKAATTTAGYACSSMAG